MQLVNVVANLVDDRNPTKTALAITPLMMLPSQRLILIPPAKSTAAPVEVLDVPRNDAVDDHQQDRDRHHPEQRRDSSAGSLFVAPLAIAAPRTPSQISARNVASADAQYSLFSGTSAA